MDDLVKSFKAQLYDRVSSPLLSSFVIAWLLWNHRLFVILLSSDLKIFEKFIYVDSVMYPTWREVLGPGFMFPLLSALAMLILYPIPGRWIYEYVRQEQQKLKKIQQRIDDETPLTVESARALRAEMRIVHEDIDAKDRHITHLRSVVQSLEEQEAQRRLSGGSMFDELRLTSRQEKFLAFTALQSFVSVAFLQQTSAANPVVIAREVDGLVESMLVQESGTDPNRNILITPKGRRYLVEKAPDLSDQYIGKTQDQISFD